MTAVVHIIKAFTKVRSFSGTAATREGLRIDDDKRKAMSELRGAEKRFTMMTSSVDLDETFGSECNLNLSTIFLRDFPAALVSEARRVMANVRKQWQHDLEELTGMINAWMPAGWDAVKDTILEPGFR